MASRVPTEQLPILLLVCWGVILALAISELFRDPSDRLVPAMLVVAFVGFLFQLAPLFRKDR
jgi:hypothetical protein